MAEEIVAGAGARSAASPDETPLQLAREIGWRTEYVAELATLIQREYAEPGPLGALAEGIIALSRTIGEVAERLERAAREG